MPDKADKPPASKSSQKLRIIDLVRPHWKALSIALVAVLCEALTDILEPWPIKIVVDNIKQTNKLPGGLGGIITRLFGQNHYAVLNFAVAAVAVIAIVGAVSSYFEKYLTTSVSQWVGHDLRRTLYQHIQRLSLAEHDESRTGDLIADIWDLTAEEVAAIVDPVAPDDASGRERPEPPEAICQRPDCSLKPEPGETYCGAHRLEAPWATE